MPPTIEGNLSIPGSYESGFTMISADRNLHKFNPPRIMVTVPNTSSSTADQISREAVMVCLNIGSEPTSAANTYERWQDLTEQEVLDEMAGIA